MCHHDDCSHNVSVCHHIRSEVVYNRFPQTCVTRMAYTVISQQGTGTVPRFLGDVYVFLSSVAMKMKNFHLFTEGRNHSLCFPGFFLANSLNFIQRIDLTPLWSGPTADKREDLKEE